SEIVSHFGYEKARWSIEQKDNDWHDVKKLYRTVTGIKKDRKKWEKAKGELGKWDVRLFRTFFILFIILLFAGFIDLIANKAFRNRGIFLVVFAITGLFLSQWLWVERQEKYIVNLMSGLEEAYYIKNGQMYVPPKSYSSLE
ncbi:MAG: hypothetical protein ACYSR9_10080, partial [Planctomycetota bacterium]